MKRVLVFCVIGLGLLHVGCGTMQQIVAKSDDLSDYRAYRVAAHEGTRLARAKRYLETHPHGAWSTEVRTALETEEPLYFAESSASRAGTSEYLADLPNGPHAESAIALLTAYDTKIDDVETAQLMRDARRTEAMLEQASVDRRAVGETILEAVGALLDPAVYGAPVENAPSALVRALSGNARSTWGKTAQKQAKNLFFMLPTRSAPLSRTASVAIILSLKNGVVEEGRVEGPDLFVRWDEADSLTALDETSPNQRASAAFHASELLAGALEARVPASRCTVATGGKGADVENLLVRQCDGFRVVVTWAREAGGSDKIMIRGPRVQK